MKHLILYNSGVADSILAAGVISNYIYSNPLMGASHIDYKDFKGMVADDIDTYIAGLVAKYYNNIYSALGVAAGQSDYYSSSKIMGVDIATKKLTLQHDVTLYTGASTVIVVNGVSYTSVVSIYNATGDYTEVTVEEDIDSSITVGSYGTFHIGLYLCQLSAAQELGLSAASKDGKVITVDSEIGYGIASHYVSLFYNSGGVPKTLPFCLDIIDRNNITYIKSTDLGATYNIIDMDALSLSYGIKSKYYNLDSLSAVESLISLLTTGDDNYMPFSYETTGITYNIYVGHTDVQSEGTVARCISSVGTFVLNHIYKIVGGAWVEQVYPDNALLWDYTSIYLYDKVTGVVSKISGYTPFLMGNNEFSILLLDIYNSGRAIINSISSGDVSPS